MYVRGARGNRDGVPRIGAEDFARRRYHFSKLPFNNLVGDLTKTLSEAGLAFVEELGRDADVLLHLRLLLADPFLLVHPLIEIGGFIDRSLFSLLHLGELLVGLGVDLGQLFFHSVLVDFEFDRKFRIC